MARSNCWLHALRLNFEHPMRKQGYTHICAVLGCGHLYNLTKLPQKEYRSNINSLYNLKKVHGGDSGAWTIKANLVLRQRENWRALNWGL
jgi:hypothetical protein